MSLPQRPTPQEYPFGYTKPSLWSRIKRGDFAGAILVGSMLGICMFVIGYNIGIAVGRVMR